MSGFPVDSHFDRTLAFKRQGYRFISNCCERLHTDVFVTRLLLRRTVCMRGEAAARLFYDERRFERLNAAPLRLKKTLFGGGGVQGMDDDAHRVRKALFMSLLGPEQAKKLALISRRFWQSQAAQWRGEAQVVLLHEAREILLRTACAWTGVPIADAEVKPRSLDFAAMIEGGAAVGYRYWRGKAARRRAEAWIAGLVREVRKNPQAHEGSPLHAVALYRENGEILDAHIAAVEVINLLRPIVAVAWYVVLCALALHRHRQYRQKVHDEMYARLFVQEVRRFYPFFPAVAARVRENFAWQGYVFPKGMRVLLDLYGTNHHPDLWDNPEEFRPERFFAWRGDAYSLIPQGGGDHAAGHRCPGEWTTIALMEAATNFLASGLDYTVPLQNLEVDCVHMPAAPCSGFLICVERA